MVNIYRRNFHGVRVKKLNDPKTEPPVYAFLLDDLQERYLRLYPSDKK